MTFPDIKYVKHAAVLGSGAYGTALACMLSKKAKTVSVWHMHKNEANRINEMRENSYFLKGVPLPSNVTFTADPEECLGQAEILLFVIPTQFLRGFLKKHHESVRKHVIGRGVPLVMCSKGIEQSSLLFPSHIVEEFFPGHPVIVLAGPSFAIEVAHGMLTRVCVAATDINQAREVQRIMNTPDGSFRCWTTADTVGCEVASAMKNVLAIASGALKGLNAGLNARAALITRGILEIRDLTLALGGSGEAVFGLAGFGDLLLTCSSELSRNFSVGLKIGKGLDLQTIQRESKAVAEGVATAGPLESLAKKYNVRLPIAHEVYAVLYEKKDVKEAFEQLSTCGLGGEGLPALNQSAKL